MPVAFHVIRKDTTSPGDVAASQIDAQVAVLNDAFADAGFRFVLTNVTRTTKAASFDLPYANGDGDPRY